MLQGYVLKWGALTAERWTETHRARCAPHCFRWGKVVATLGHGGKVIGVPNVRSDDVGLWFSLPGIEAPAGFSGVSLDFKRLNERVSGGALEILSAELTAIAILTNPDRPAFPDSIHCRAAPLSVQRARLRLAEQTHFKR